MKMKILYLGILIVTSFLYASPSRVKRFSSNGQRSDWNWNRNDHFSDAQTKSTSQANWPTKGSGGSTKGRGDSNANRDGGTWSTDSWSTGENGDDGYDMGWNTEPQGNNKGSAYPEEDGGQGGDLEKILGGVPGMDFPNFLVVPKTDFDCSLMPSQGYYGDVEAGCQVFHICQPGNRKNSFLCPVGTIFNQKYFVCDWWFNVNCNDTPSYYELNNNIYIEADPITEDPVETVPWDGIDRKKPTKSWGNQPSTGKQNPRSWKDTATRRGAKSPDSVTTSRDVSNSWSRSDVQKEITVSWGTSSGTTSGTSAASSSSFIPTTKPLWYGIDGQPAKDQSNGMSKRTGLVQTPVPFGTRMRKSTATSATDNWTTTAVYQPTTTSKSHGTSSTKAWHKSSDISIPPTTRKWLKEDDSSDAPKLGNGNKWNSEGNAYPTTRKWLKEDDSNDAPKLGNGNKWNSESNAYPTTSGWIKIEDTPETSINPTGIKGVWEQETTKRSEQKQQSEANVVGHKGFVTKSGNHSAQNGQKFRAVSNQRKEWDKRQTFRNTQSSKVSNRNWGKNKIGKQSLFENSNTNSIPRRNSWK